MKRLELATRDRLLRTRTLRKPRRIAPLLLLPACVLLGCSSGSTILSPQVEPARVPPLSPEARQQTSSDQLSKRVSTNIERWEQMLQMPSDAASAALQSIKP